MRDVCCNYAKYCCIAAKTVLKYRLKRAIAATTGKHKLRSCDECTTNDSTEEKMKKFFGEFKKFINRGNVIDLAVGVIIGGAFSKITASLVSDLIMPLITFIFALCGVEGGLDGMCFVLNDVDKYVTDTTTGAKVINPAAITWNYGNFIQTVLDFLLIALVLFFIVKAINFASDEYKRATMKSPFTKEELKQMRAQGLTRRQIRELENKRREEIAEEEARKAEEEAPKTQEELLQEIIDIMRPPVENNEVAEEVAEEVMQDVE